MKIARGTSHLCAALVGLLCAAGSSAKAQVTVLPEEGGAQVPDAERHAVADGETLSLLAERYLGDADAWPRLWSFNPEITNPHWIYPGLVLRLKEGVDLNGPVAAAGATGAAGAGSAGRLRFARRAAPPLGSVMIGEEVYLDREALAQAARIVGSKQDKLLLSPTDEVYLQFGAKAAAPSEGKELTVFIRRHRAEVAPKAGRFRTHYADEAGEVVRVLGGLRVKSYDADKRIARAVVTEALDPIERGFEVADIPRRLAQVPPKVNGRDATGKIVLATRPLGTLATGQVAFVDLGSKSGVEVGNRLVVVRQGDPWRQQLSLREELTGAERPERQPVAGDQFPPEIVGELRVLYVRPESATALITSALVELHPGDRVELRAGQ